MNASCCCGAVKFTTPANKPLKLYHCHCIDCRRQSSSAFGTSAIFAFFRLGENPAVSSFVRHCDTGNRQQAFFCKLCGSRIMHVYILDQGDPEFVSVKGGLLEGLDWSGAIHIFCRSAVVPIPEGVERWEAEPET